MEAGEDEILRRAAQGNGDGMGDLLEGYRPRLARMIDVRMDPLLRNRVDASDVIQEAYIEVTARLPKYLERADMPFFIWVRFLTGQKLLQIHRKHLGAEARNIRAEVPLRGGAPGASSVSMASAFLDAGGSPSSAAIRDEEQGRLVEALDTMEDVDREVLTLRHFERMSIAETAGILGISESAASRRHVRALARLQKHMKPSTRDDGAT